MENHYITPWGPVGYITYKRTYARKLDSELKTEEFENTIDRVLDACETQLRVGFSQEEREIAKGYFMKLKASVAGRFLWQLGTKTVDKYGLMSLQNCCFVIVDNPIKPFTWTFDSLMVGCGVGFNIQREHVYQIPPVKGINTPIKRLDTKDADFIVPDSREGWVELLERVLNAYFYTGKGFTYSTICIRKKGELIKGFGGEASGPEELVQGIEDICKILNKRSFKKLRPIDCLDLMNILGFIVVSGNVRRSALIALGDYDDFLFLKAKRWDLGKIPNWRSMSNNSVICNDINHLPEQFWESYKPGCGEPYGLINLKLLRESGRLKDGNKYPDPNVNGVNPCSEQGLNNLETCCLGEIFLPNIESKNELIDVLKIIYRICKHSLTLPCHHPETEAIVHKNMRMGIGVTGYLQATSEQKSWLSDCYEELRKFDADYSKQNNLNPSIKLTTCKPSGTLSLLPGVTPGIHPGFSQYFIRRIRVASNSPLVDLCIKHGYKVESVRNFDNTEDPNTKVVEFPCSYPKGTVLAGQLTAIKQLEYVREMQTNWSDNAVSVTVYYKNEELEDIKNYLKNNYNSTIKTVSFLLYQDHGFDQAPYEEISEEKYFELMGNTKQITSDWENESFDIYSQQECAGGACPIR